MSQWDLGLTAPTFTQPISRPTTPIHLGSLQIAMPKTAERNANLAVTDFVPVQIVVPASILAMHLTFNENLCDDHPTAESNPG